MSKLVEHVAKAIVYSPPHERIEYAADGPKIIRDFEPTSRAAIRATLEFARDNVSEGMATAMRLASMNVQGGYGGPSGWEAAIDALLAEIEGGTG